MFFSLFFTPTRPPLSTLFPYTTLFRSHHGLDRPSKFKSRRTSFDFDFSDVGLYDSDLFLNVLAVLLLATIGFALEPAKFLLEHTNFIDGLFYDCHQAPFLASREFESSDELRQIDSRTSEFPTGTSNRCPFRLRSHSEQFHAEGIYLFICRGDLADSVQGFLELLFNFVVRQFLIA